MEQMMYSIWDEKAKAYATPFFSANEQTALRAFAHVCNDPGTLINQNPGDFKLYQIGDFDMNDGELIACDKPKFVEHASSVIVKERVADDDNC